MTNRMFVMSTVAAIGSGSADFLERRLDDWSQCEIVGTMSTNTGCCQFKNDFNNAHTDVYTDYAHIKCADSSSTCADNQFLELGCSVQICYQSVGDVTQTTTGTVPISDNCEQYTVRQGDSCYKIMDEWNTAHPDEPTSYEQMYDETLEKYCSDSSTYIQAGDVMTICWGDSTTTTASPHGCMDHTVEVGDSCWSIMTAWNANQPEDEQFTYADLTDTTTGASCADDPAPQLNLGDNVRGCLSGDVTTATTTSDPYGCMYHTVVSGDSCWSIMQSWNSDLYPQQHFVLGDLTDITQGVSCGASDPPTLQLGDIIKACVPQ